MKPIIVANWKCKPTTQEEAVELFNKISEGVKDVKNAEVVICPPFIYIPAVDNKYHISLGAQKCFVEEKEVSCDKFSPKTAKEAGCDFIIVGHSSRRGFLGETDEMINQELKDSLFVGLIPILCLGETSNERQESKTEAVLEAQIRNDLQGIFAVEVSKIIFTYEPVWAISDGDPYKKEIPTPENIRKARTLIENILEEIYGNALGKIRIIYGGSTNASNTGWILGEAGMDGLLVGRGLLETG